MRAIREDRILYARNRQICPALSYCAERVIETAKDGKWEPSLPISNRCELPPVQQLIGRLRDMDTQNLVTPVDFEDLVQITSRRTVIELTATAAGICVHRCKRTLRLRGKIIQSLRPREIAQQGETVPEALFKSELKCVVIAVYPGINGSD